jgi:hypothetical protein
MVRKTRNPVARSPLLRKGGRHEKSKSAKRMQDKKSLRSEVAEADRNRHSKKP